MCRYLGGGHGSVQGFSTDRQKTRVFVHISADTGLHKVHPTWAGTYILDACVFLFPTINFALIDSDCVPVTLFEIRELWLASTDPTRPATSSKVAKSKLSGPIASSHKRARSVDTGRDMQQPGPPSKLSTIGGTKSNDRNLAYG